jgi:PST family polysaccharide transporter
LTIVVGIFRTKAVAVLLGPGGVGLLGLFNAICDLAVAVAGMGAGSSGVRQIAEAVGSGDERRIARTVMVLRRTVPVLGVLGAAALVILARPVSTLSFGTDDHAGAVALLGGAVMFRLVTDGQSGLLQGLRRIGDLARTGVIGSVVGTVVTVTLVYAFGEDGIALSLVGGAAAGLTISWIYARRVRLAPVTIGAAETRREVAALLRLGFAFMLSGLLMLGASYVIRMMVARRLGIEAAGLYQAAWTLGAMYVTLILSAMNKDYYPRLTGVAHDRSASNRVVNEQAQVAMLLAGPGILATLSFAPLVLATFYAGPFEAAAGILRWICLATALQVVLVPVGYILLARNAQKFFIATEAAWTVAHLGLAWLCLDAFGVDGAGMAFFGAYALHGLLLYPIARRLNGFRWSAENRRGALRLAGLVGGVFLACSTLPAPAAMAIGAAATLLSTVHALRALAKLAPLGKLLRRRRAADR